MPWVTINGAHVLIGEDGGKTAGGARREAQAAKERARAAATVRAARVAGKPGDSPGGHTSKEMLVERGRIQGYRDTTNYAVGPKHTRHALPAMIKRLDRAEENTSAGMRNQHWWSGYEQGVRQAQRDWTGHMTTAAGGVTVRTVRRLEAVRARRNNQGS